MNTRQFLQYESIRHCQVVLRGKRFKGPEIDTLRQRFDRAADDVQKLWYEQEKTHRESRGEAGELRRMRADLRKRLLRISRRAVVVLDGMPGIRDDLRVPHANVKNVDLLKSGARIVRNLRPYRQEPAPASSHAA